MQGCCISELGFTLWIKVMGLWPNTITLAVFGLRWLLGWVARFVVYVVTSPYKILHLKINTTSKYARVLQQKKNYLHGLGPAQRRPKSKKNPLEFGHFTLKTPIYFKNYSSFSLLSLLLIGKWRTKTVDMRGQKSGRLKFYLFIERYRFSLLKKTYIFNFN